MENNNVKSTQKISKKFYLQVKWIVLAIMILINQITPLIHLMQNCV